ncbi:MAG: M23 family metallopeptidase [Rhodospirillaceae bacterium]|nr:M23 family metallopeptidase [Rhodospirillaceae bacterium]
MAAGTASAVSSRHMNRSSLVAALAGALLFGSVAAAQTDDLPFTRQIAVGGTIAGSLEASTATAGVPAAAMVEALQAFATSIDFGRDVRDGDRFHVRYEQTFTLEGVPIGTGRVIWAELRTTAKGTLAIHRFRTRDGAERFWLANGQGAAPPSMRLPVEIVSISSGFGLRADPFDQPPPPPTAGKSGAMGGPMRTPPGPPPGLKPGTITGETPLASSGGSSSYGRPTPGPSPYGNWQQAPRVTRSLFMHEGVDLVAPAGTPVRAAADGVVIGAAPNGRYGNWIRIDHAGKLTTVYGHLSGFAPDIVAGTKVSRGDVIGFVGSTGRSTGAHLHFELLADGKPVNPITHPETRRGVLRGPDLDRLRKQVAQSLAERDREAAVAASFRD